MRREGLAAADCGIAQTLGVLGDWWTVLIVREVVGGTTRFDAIQSALGISRRALTERLASLVQHGVLDKVAYSTRPPRHDYLLSPRGEGLVPVLAALQEFGDRHLLGDGGVTATLDHRAAGRVHALLGRQVPDLSLTAHDATAVAVRPEGRWRVLYLFPGAFAPGTAGHPPDWGQVPGAAGCTLESTTYAAHHDDFAAAGADVVGVSTQRPDQLAAFAEHARLPFRLLSDPDARLGTSLRLGLFRAAGTDRYQRQTLLLDPSGTARHVQAPVTDPAGSVTDMLSALRALAS